MRRALVAVAVSTVLLVACQPAPTATITNKADPARPICGSTGRLYGTVSPAGATPKVVLQKTRNGKWEDWIWLQGLGSTEGSHRIYGTVDPSTGAWSFQYSVPIEAKTIHVRVRSLGGSVASPGLYLTPRPASSDVPCPTID